MPKGEHFKKKNPRNFQVSFKVNQTELDLLNKLANQHNLSVAEWLRSHITADDSKSFTPKTVKQTPKKASVSKDVIKGDQTSLF